jgi:threonine dehydrogenase-like Zn-dependent dehydrogenase
MRALVLKEFGRFAVEEVPTPEFGDHDVRIAVIATGICGSDIHGFTGKNGRRFPGQVMGHESVGRVDALGASVDPGSLQVGQLVTFNPLILTPEDARTFAGREQHAPGRRVVGVDPAISAAFGEYLVVPQENVVPLPESMPVEYGALIEPLAVAFHAVARAGVERGNVVLVLGGGPIGQSLILAARRAGASRVVVSEPDAGRRALCTRLGAEAVDTADGPLPVQLAALGIEAADVALDAVGISPTVGSALESTRLGGTVCLVGMGSPTIELGAFLVSTGERSIVGSFTYTRDDFARAAAWASTAPEELRELVSGQVSLDEANEAFVGLAAGDGTPGKILVRLR